MNLNEILNRSKKLGISSKVSDSLEKALKFVSKDEFFKTKNSFNHRIALFNWLLFRNK